MTAPSPWQLRLAWQIARRLRTCPPPRLFAAVPAAPELIAHAERCPFCTERLTAETAAAAVPFALPRPRPAPEPRSADPHPGEIRAVQPELGAWGPGGCYFNPPMVLVVEVPADLEDAVRVMQLYDDLALAGPGDLPIDPEDPNLYAETWNSYALRFTDLGRHYGQVSAATLAAVRAAGEPATAAAIDPDSTLAAFRRLEVETAAFFATRALEEILAAREATVFDQIERQFRDWLELHAHLRKRQPHLRMPEQAASIAEGLLLTCFADSSDLEFAAAESRDRSATAPRDATVCDRDLPLAAAAPQRVELIRVLRWEDEELRIETGLAEITVWRPEADRLTVGGRCQGSLPDRAAIYARFQKPNGTMRAPAQTDFSSDGCFRLLFTGLTEVQIKHGRLLAVVGGK